MVEAQPQTQPNTPNPVSSENLTQWVQNPAENSEELSAAILAQSVIVTTREKFDTLIANATTYAKNAAAYKDEAVRLQIENVLLKNSVFYLLKSLEGVADQSDAIVELLKLFGVGDSKAPNKAVVAGKIIMHGSKIVDLGGKIMGAFDANWLTKIDLEKLAPLFEQYPLNFEAYAKLAGLSAAIVEPTQTPA